MRPPRFLVDECLHTVLVRQARERGYHAMSVRDLGLLGAKDWELMGVVLDSDWCLVTANARDFRGPAHARGNAGEYAGVALHPGLVCLHGEHPFDAARQSATFAAMLDEVARLPQQDTTNLLIEVTWATEDNGGCLVEVFDFPEG